MVGVEHLFLDYDGPASFKKRLARVLFVLVLCGIVVAIAIGETREALHLDAWSPEPCRIIESHVDSVGTGRSRENPYHVRVTFAYQASGHAHIGKTTEWRDNGSDDAAEAYGTVRRYPPGLNTVCYVNPREPDKAVLSKSNLLGAESFLVGASGVTVAWLWFYCVPQLRGRKSAQRKNDLMRPVALFFAVLLMCGFGAMLVGWYVIPLAQELASLEWRAVPCSIVEGNIMRNEVHAQVSLTFYHTDIHYRYEVDGKEYHSNRFSFTEGATFFAFARERISREFPAGRSTVCFVDPHNPENAVLVRYPSPGLFNAGYPLAVVLLAAFMLALRGDDARATATLRRYARTLILLGILITAGIIGAQFAPP
jgi:hypothetical protein